MLKYGKIELNCKKMENINLKKISKLVKLNKVYKLISLVILGIFATWGIITMPTICFLILFGLYIVNYIVKVVISKFIIRGDDK